MSVPYKKPYKKATYKKKPYSAANTKLKQEVRAEVMRELRSKADLKYCDAFSSANTNITSTGAVYNILSNLVRGDAGLDNFNGNSIKVKGLTLNYGCHSNQTYNYCRVMLIQWYDSGTPSLTGILNSTTTGVAPFANIYVTNRKNIKVLYDKTFAIAPTAGGDSTVTGEGTFMDKVYIDGSRMTKVTYQTGANTIQDGGLYLIAVSDDSLTTYPQITWGIRVSFYDD